MKQKFLKETTWSIVSKIFALLFFISLNIFLARYLGPDVFGAWSYFYSVLSIIFLFSYFGINASSKKYIAQYNQTDNLGSVLKSSIKIRFVFSIVFVLIFLILHGLLATLLGREDFALLFVVSVPLIFFLNFVEFFKHVFEGLHNLKYVFVITMFEHSLKFLFAFILLFYINSLTTILLSYNLAYLLTALIGLFIFYSYLYKEQQVYNHSFDREIIRYSLPLFFVSIGFSILVELDTVMIGILSTDSEVGIYAVAKQIIVKIPHIALAIALGTMPVFAKWNEKNKDNLKIIFYNLLKANSLLFGSIGFLLLATSWYFIPLLFGQAYSASVTPLMILVFYMVLFSYSIFLSTFLDYQGLATKRAVNLSITIVLNIILNLLFIPRLGAVGAAIGTSVSYAPYVLLNWIEVNRFLRRF